MNTNPYFLPFFRLDDEWVEISDHRRKLIRKRIKLCNLPEEAKSKVTRKLFGVPPSQMVFDNNEKTKDKSHMDTSWIKVERDEDSTSRSNELDGSRNNSSNQITRSSRKQSRKYQSSTNNGGLYNSSIIKPPKGLF